MWYIIDNLGGVLKRGGIVMYLVTMDLSVKGLSVSFSRRVVRHWSTTSFASSPFDALSFALHDSSATGLSCVFDRFICAVNDVLDDCSKSVAVVARYTVIDLYDGKREAVYTRYYDVDYD